MGFKDLFLLLLCEVSVGLVFERAHNSSQPSGALIAAIIAVHKPKFNFVLDLAEQWQGCAEARRTMDLLPIFSTPEEEGLFSSKLRVRKIDPTVIIPLVAQPLPEGAKPSSWKKLEGLAQVLEHKKNYEFSLMLDSEIQLRHCRGFESVLSSLRQKHESRVWYGNTKPEESNSRGKVSRAVAALSPSGDVMARLANETKNMRVYTWWNDVPFVHRDLGTRMFQHWAREIQTATGRVGGQLTPTRVLEAKVPDLIQLFNSPSDEAARMNPTSVSGDMGAGHGESMQVAGQAFEHLIYQLYTVGYEGFHVQDLTDRAPTMNSVSVLENFWNYSATVQDYIMKTVHPLWLPAHNLESGGDGVFLTFHLDRIGRY